MYKTTQGSLGVKLLFVIGLSVGTQCAIANTSPYPDTLFQPAFRCSDKQSVSDTAICSSKKLSLLNKMWAWNAAKAIQITPDLLKERVSQYFYNWEKKTFALCKEDKQCLEKQYNKILREMDITTHPMQTFMYEAGGYGVSLSEENQQGTFLWHTFTNKKNTVGIIYKCKNTDLQGFICVFNELLVG